MSQLVRNADELPAVGTPVERPVGRPEPEREEEDARDFDDGQDDAPRFSAVAVDRRVGRQLSRNA